MADGIDGGLLACYAEATRMSGYRLALLIRKARLLTHARYEPKSRQTWLLVEQRPSGRFANRRHGGVADLLLHGYRVEAALDAFGQPDRRKPVVALEILLEDARRRIDACSLLAEHAQQRVVLELTNDDRPNSERGEPLIDAAPDGGVVGWQ